MSDDTSLWSSLKNNVQKKVEDAIVDPEADKRAKEKAEEIKKKEEEKKEEEVKKKQKEATVATGDPNKFSAKRLFSKIWNQTTSIFKIIFIPFISLMLSMLVANEMIVYTPPIRILFFIVTCALCLLFPFYLGLLSFIYLIKGGYSYYVNHMTDGPKKHIMPTIFALLPITTYKPVSSLGKFFLYPFTYPKSEEDIEKLPSIMDDYWKQLMDSFPGLKQVKNLPMFVEGLKKAEEHIKHLHDPKEISSETNNTEKNVEQKNEVE